MGSLESSQHSSVQGHAAVGRLFPEFWVGICQGCGIPMAQLKLHFSCQGFLRIIRAIPIHKQGLRLILLEGVLRHGLNRDQEYSHPSKYQGCKCCLVGSLRGKENPPASLISMALGFSVAQRGEKLAEKM